MLDASYFPFFCASFQRIPAALNIYRQRNFCTFCHRPHYKSLPFSSNPVLLYSLAPQHVSYSHEVQKKSIPNIIGPPHSLCCLITFTLYSWANTHTFPHEKSGNDRYKRQKKVKKDLHLVLEQRHVLGWWNSFWQCRDTVPWQRDGYVGGFLC